MNNRNWLWFFFVLVVLSIAGIGINYWYNMRQQLKPEELAAAKARWKEKGPADYDLTIRKELNSAAGGLPEREEIQLQVRGGKAIGGTLNGRELEPRVWAQYEVPEWFLFFDEFMTIDTKPGAAPVFCTGQFDPTDGHPLHYVRRVMGTRQRVELHFDLRRVGDGRSEGQQS